LDTRIQYNISALKKSLPQVLRRGLPVFKNRKAAIVNSTNMSTEWLWQFARIEIIIVI